MKVIFFVILVGMLCGSASAGISYDAMKIYVSGGSYNLTDVYTTINNNDIIASEGDGVWVLKYPISVASGGTLYINSSDTSWIKMTVTNSSFFAYLKNQGSMYIDGVKITSWNTTTNNVIDTGTHSDPRPYILFSTATGTSSLKNSNVSYMGYSGGSYTTGIDCNDPANNTTVSGCILIHNRVGLMIDEHNATVSDCYIANSSAYGLQIVNSVSPIYGIRVTNVTSEYNDAVNIYIKPYTTTGTLYNAVFDRCKSRHGPGNLYNLVYLRDSIVRNCDAFQTGRNNDWHSGFDFKTNCDNVTVENCTAGNCQNAFYVHNYDTNITLRNNTAYDSDTGFSISSGSKNCRVENCTAYGQNTTNSGAGFSGHSGSDNIFINCTAYDVYWGGDLQPLNWTVVDDTMPYVPEFLCYNNSFIDCNFSGSAYDYNLAPSGQTGVNYSGVNNIIDCGSISLATVNTSAVRIINSLQDTEISGVAQYYYLNVSVRNNLGQFITGATITAENALNGYGQPQSNFITEDGKLYNRSNWIALETGIDTEITATKDDKTDTETATVNDTFFSIDVSNLQGIETVLTLDIFLPFADFTASETFGVSPLKIKFTDTSLVPVDSLAWDFGDGSPVVVNVSVPIHTYSRAGNYSVNLTVTAGGNVSYELKEHYITVTDPTDPTTLDEILAIIRHFFFGLAEVIVA